MPISATSAVNGFFSFPNPVNEVTARLVAAMVVVVALSLAFILTGHQLFLIVLAYGF